MSDVRAGNGRYERDPDVAARDVQACRLRAQNLTYQEIADELDVSSKRQAYESVQRALRDTVQEPAEEVRQFELMRLDARAARGAGA
jgi:orotate phosphoribosyltransferase-like protein